MANSHATKNAFKTTSPRMIVILPSKSGAESHWSAIVASAFGVAARKGENKKFMERMRAAHPRDREPVSYQLDFVTPGMNPPEASSRKVRREILNRRINARRRPLTSQRLTTRVGLASRGSCDRPI